MKVLHLASSNRWTGAAAPAFAEVESLRLHGVDAHYAYVGGYKLEDKLRGRDYCHPIIRRRQDPLSSFRTIHAIRELQKRHRFDILHAHLTHDHLLTLGAARDAVTVRTFHSRRTIRRDPVTGFVLSRTAGVFVVNETHRALFRRDAFFTPPPLDTAQFRPDGPDQRAALGFAAGERVVGIIGKLAPERGFEAAIETVSVMRRDDPRVRLMIIGHGPHRAVLEALARERDVAGAVVFAGYHESDLDEYYRSADVMLFTAAGSDEGHRAILEELGCGVPVAAYPIDGVAALLGPMAGRCISREATPESLASTVREVLASENMRTEAARRAESFSYAESGRKLRALYESLLARRA